MDDLISRQVAVDTLRSYIIEQNVSDDESEIKGYNDGLETAISVLSTLPSAQPEPPEDICGECDAWNKYKSERKTGRWIGYLEPGNENYHCSACGTAWYPEDLYLGGNDYPKYCPECGAQMENWQSYPGEGAQDG